MPYWPTLRALPADRTQTLGGSWSTSGLSQPANRRPYTGLCSSPTPGDSAVPSTHLPEQSAPPTPMRPSRYFAPTQAMCSFVKLILNLRRRGIGSCSGEHGSTHSVGWCRHVRSRQVG